MGSEGTLRVKVVGDVADFQKKMKDGGTVLGQFGDIASDVAKRGFSALTGGAEEMSRAQGNFQAATGRSAAEARAFAGDMNNLVGNANTVGVSFQGIAAAGTQVAQQFGLTGEAGSKLTDNFLGFAKVTGQDATGAVDDFDAALDAFGEPAERATGLMDQLVASNQKYGTDAGPAAVDALRNMAPALTAMGEGIDYGIGALNLFETAGIDASTGQQAFNKAIDDMPPGGSFDDIIAKLGAIEDPARRDAAAVEIFGEKAGHKMALAIKPGMTSLDEFQVSMGEAAGATEDASNSMVTDSDKIKMAFEKLTAGARTLGQDFGPALMGLQSVGSLLGPLAGKFGDLLKTLAARLIPSAIVAGTAVGVAQGEAQAVAATGPGVVQSMATRIAAMSIPLAGAGTTVGTAVGGAMAVGVSVGWIAVIGGALAVAAFGPRLLLEKLTGNDQEGRIRGATIAWAVSAGFAEAAPGAADAAVAAFVETMNSGGTQQEAYAAGEAAARAYADGFVIPWKGVADNSSGAAAFAGYMAELEGRAVVGGHATARGWTEGQEAQLRADRATNAAAYAETTRAAMLEAHQIAAWGGEQTPGAFSQGLRSAFDTVRTAFTDLKDLMANTLSPIKQEAELIAIATSKRMAAALADGRPEVRGEAQQIALDSIAQLHRLDATSPEIGRLAMKLLAGATAAEKPAIQDALDKILGVFTADSNETYVSNGATGIAGAWRKGIVQELGSGATKSAIAAAVRAAMGALHGDSPPKEGPLTQIDKWGANIADAWIRGVAGRLRSGVGEISATLSAMGNGTAGLVGPPGQSLAGAGAGGAAGGHAGAPITVNAYGQDDVERQLERYDRRRRLRESLQGA